MDVERLFQILIDGLRNKKKQRTDYERRLIDAVKKFDKILEETEQIKTGPLTKKKKKEEKKRGVFTMKDFRYHIFMEIAKFLPYEDLYYFMESNVDIYLIMAQLNYFWEEKFKKEFMGYEYPENLNMVNVYYLNIIGGLKWPGISLDKMASSYKETSTLLKSTYWFRKTMLFFDRLKQVHATFKRSPFSNIMNYIDLNFNNYLQQYLARIHWMDANLLYTNKSFVVGLILFHDSLHVFPYMERNKPIIDVDILVKSIEMGIDKSNIIHYTRSPSYMFDRNDFIKKIEHFYLEEFVGAYDYLKGDYEIGKIALAWGPENIEFVTNNELKNDPEIALMVIKSDIDLFEHFGDKIRNDPRVCGYIVSKRGIDLKLCGYNIQKNKTIVEIAAHNDARALKYANYALKIDPEFMLKILKSKRLGVRYDFGQLDQEELMEIFVAKHIRSNPEIMFEAYRLNNKVYAIMEKFLTDDNEYTQSLSKHLKRVIW